MCECEYEFTASDVLPFFLFLKQNFQRFNSHSLKNTRSSTSSLYTIGPYKTANYLTEESI